VSTELSLSRDRSLVVKIPAAENALSASTDVGGAVNKYTSTLSPNRSLVSQYCQILPPQLWERSLVAICLVSQEWKKQSQLAAWLQEYRGVCD